MKCIGTGPSQFCETSAKITGCHRKLIPVKGSVTFCEKCVVREKEVLCLPLNFSWADQLEKHYWVNEPKSELQLILHLVQLYLKCFIMIGYAYLND